MRDCRPWARLRGISCQHMHPYNVILVEIGVDAVSGEWTADPVSEPPGSAADQLAAARALEDLAARFRIAARHGIRCARQPCA